MVCRSIPGESEYQKNAAQILNTASTESKTQSPALKKGPDHEYRRKEIVAALKAGAPDLNEPALSQWYQSGHQAWLVVFRQEDNHHQISLSCA